MDEVKVKRVELLAKLRDNKTKHEQVYKDAIEGYRVTVLKQLEKAKTKVEKGELVGTLNINIPKDHTEQYTEVIAMLDMSVEDEIELNKYEFNNYVLDKWISEPEKHMLRTYALSSSNSANYVAGI